MTASVSPIHSGFSKPDTSPDQKRLHQVDSINTLNSHSVLFIIRFDLVCTVTQPHTLLYMHVCIAFCWRSRELA